MSHKRNRKVVGSQSAIERQKHWNASKRMEIQGQNLEETFDIINDHLHLSIDNMTDVMHLNDNLFSYGKKYA